MMKITLVQCPCSFGVEMPPLGLAYLYATLVKAGYEASVLDLSIKVYQEVTAEQKIYWDSNNGYQWYLEDSFHQLPFITEQVYEKCMDRILAATPDVIGFSVQNTSALFTLEILKRIKSRHPGVKIILGGPNCYNLTQDDNNLILPYGLQKFADVIVIGEGEQTLLTVLSRLQSGESLEGCKGVAIERNGKWVFPGMAPSIMNLNDLPFPDFSMLDLQAYTDPASLPIQTSRGCVMRCVFCTDTQFWHPFRFRNAENIVAEMETLHQKYGCRFFGINDSVINGNLSNLLRLCDLMIQKKLNVSWGGNFRVDKRIDTGMLQKIRKAGCCYVTLGIESGSNKILRLMGKGFTIEEAERFIIQCGQVGIDVVVNWIVGFPGETEEDFMQTYRFITKNVARIKRNTFSSLTINQFSRLEKRKEEFGVILDGYHLGLWRSVDGQNTIEVRNERLKRLEDIERKGNKEYSVVRQEEVAPVRPEEAVPARRGKITSGRQEGKIPSRQVGLYIPCFNAEKTLPACLEAVFRQTYPVAEVVVVDDGSTDRTCEIASSYGVRLLRHETNRGLAAARNTAIKNMNTEFVASLDADCVAENDWLSRLMRRFDDPKICGMGGKLIEDKTSSVFDQWRAVHMKQYWESENKTPNFLFGANTVLRRQAVLDVGFYDETLRNNYEDVKLSQRFMETGYLLEYEAGAIAHHLKQDDLSSLFNTFWNWRREYYDEQKFFSNLESFSMKMKDNVGLANRYLDEDLAAQREPLLYLDFFLALHHSLMDLRYFIFRDTGAHDVKKASRLSSWLSLIDLTFCFRYAGKKKTMSSMLHSKESFPLNFLALILAINRCIVDTFGETEFRRLLYKHLLLSVYNMQDDVLLEKLMGQVQSRPDWTGLLEKEHPHLNACFLVVSQLIKKWLDEQKFRSPDLTGPSDLIDKLKRSQAVVELNINKRDLIHEN